MRHLSKGRKFHRKKGIRKSFIKGLISNLIIYKKIETTEARAKELKRKAEKIITLAKKQNTASFRLLISRIGKKAAEEVFYEVAPKLAKRAGGYTRIIRSPRNRKRDGAKLVIIELIF